MMFTEKALDSLNNYEIITESGCHIFMGLLSPKGYGRIQIDKKSLRMHRVSYEYHKGKIPKNLHVLHSCDIKCCINPEHLRAGTHQDNMDDAVIRNRMHKALGEENNMAVLTEIQARDIKYGHFKHAYYMKKYNVASSTVQDIRAGRSWRHLNDVN